MSLAYEVTAKMAADIHTKSFKDSVSWTHECQLINIFPPALIGSQEIMDLMRPTHAQSADEKGHQHYSFKGEVPCFPYTETPILPQVLYRAGLSSKEGLQEHDSVYPILVVKFPRMLRGPPSALPPGRYLRSTWIRRPSSIATWSVLCFSFILYVVSCARPPCRKSICLPFLNIHLLASALLAPCQPNGGRWLPRWRAPSMGGIRASHYLFDSMVVPICGEFRMWETRNGPRLSRMCGNIWR